MTKIPNRLSRVLISVGVIAPMLLSVPQAASAAATANLEVSAAVSASCSISTTALAFGAYDPVVAHAATALTAEGAVLVTCTSGSGAVITLGQGANADTGSTDAAPARRMVSSVTNHLAYHLYSDSERATLWGNTEATGLAEIGTGTQESLQVYGRIPAAQNVPAGTYTDTVVATVTF